MNDLQSFGLHRLWKGRLARLAGVAPGDRALDVCCGTGDLSVRLANHGARVIGCDFSGPMLRAARAHQRVKYLQADALNLPLRSEQFDQVTIGYGLRNLPDFRAGLAELLRVLKPGGKLLILDFGKPPNRWWRAAYFTYLRVVVPLFGLVFCGDRAAYAYILESLREYPAQEGVAELLRELGVGTVEIHDLLGGVMSIHVATRRSSCQGHDVALKPGGLLGQ